MGIRFRCHHCEHELNVKDYLAGKRGKCPKCEGKFRVPASDASHSLSIDSVVAQPKSAEREISGQSSQPDVAQSSTRSSQGVQQGVTDVASARSSGAQVAGESVTSTGSGARDGGLVVQAESKIESRATGSQTELPAAQEGSVPAAIAEAKESTWYVRISDGSQFGPATGEVFLLWLGENRIQKDSLVWRDGWEQWRAASEVLADYYDQLNLPQAATPGGGIPNATSKTIESASPTPGSSTADLSDTPNASGSGMSTGQKSRLEKRLRRKRNYRLTITFLSVAAVLLIVALVIVLIVQQQ